MSNTIEIERTFLLNSVPSNLSNYTKKHLLDIYLPPTSDNPQIRLRQINQEYYLTKKYPKNPSDLSIMVEETINLSKDEFEFLEANLKGNILEKTRYTLKSENYQIDLDVYLGNLKPLIILDVELVDINTDIDYVLSQFDINKEVTNNQIFAAGKMAGKFYKDIVNL